MPKPETLNSFVIWTGFEFGASLARNKTESMIRDFHHTKDLYYSSHVGFMPA